MKVEDLANYINMESIPNSWRVAFDEISNEIPEKIDWLDIEKSKEILDFYELKEQNYRKQYLETVQMVNNDEVLKNIVYLWHYILYRDNSNLANDVWSWKTTMNLYKKHGNYMLPVIAMLSGYTIHKQMIKKRGFSQNQIKCQKENINKTCTNDGKRYNINGIRFSQMIWGSYFMKGKIIQVGRLQYELKVTNFDKLKKYVGNDTDYIYIHIPEGENLLEEDVERSLIEAKKYIGKYYPEINIKKLVFYTQTWLLSDELDDILNDDSNIMKFKKRFKIIEQEECEQDFLNFIFKEGMNRNIDYNKLKEDTYLQKKIKEHLIKGGKLHIGLGIMK